MGQLPSPESFGAAISGSVPVFSPPKFALGALGQPLPLIFTCGRARLEKFDRAPGASSRVAGGGVWGCSRETPLAGNQAEDNGGSECRGAQMKGDAAATGQGFDEHHQQGDDKHLDHGVAGDRPEEIKKGFRHVANQKALPPEHAELGDRQNQREQAQKDGQADLSPLPELKDAAWQGERAGLHLVSGAQPHQGRPHTGTGLDREKRKNNARTKGNAG